MYIAGMICFIMLIFYGRLQLKFSMLVFFCPTFMAVVDGDKTGKRGLNTKRNKQERYEKRQFFL